MRLLLLPDEITKKKKKKAFVLWFRLSPSGTEHLVSFLSVQTQNNYPVPVFSAVHLTKHSHIQ